MAVLGLWVRVRMVVGLGEGGVGEGGACKADRKIAGLAGEGD